MPTTLEFRLAATVRRARPARAVVVFLLAATMLIRPGSAAAQAVPTLVADELTWSSFASDDEVTLSYGVPESDADTRFNAFCKRRTGRVEVFAGTVRSRPKNPAFAVTMFAPGGSLALAARAVRSQSGSGFELVADLADARQLVATLAKPGTLVIEGPGVREEVPLGPAAARAVATFRRHCPSAR